MTRKTTSEQLDRAHTYLARKTFELSLAHFRNGAFIKCLPFELQDREGLTVHMFSKWWKRMLWHFVHTVFYLHTIFILVTFGLTLASKPFGNEAVMHLMYVMCVLYGGVFMLSCYLKPQECAFMLNQHEFILKAVSRMRMEVPHWTSHYFVMIGVPYFSFVLFVVWCVQATMFMWRPHSPWYVYYYLPAGWQNVWTFLLYLAYELTWTAWYLTAFGAFFCYWCACIFTINSVAATLMACSYTKMKDIKMYEYLQLFAIAFNDFNGSFFTVGFTTMLLVIPILGIYISLTMFASLKLFIFLFFPSVSSFAVFLIMFFLPQHSKVGMISTDLVKVLRSRRIRDRWGLEAEQHEPRIEDVLAKACSRLTLKKRARAFAPLGIRIWYFGIYTLATSQELIDQLFNNVLLLLSL